MMADLAAVAALVLANGFFVASEFALVTVRRTRIEQLAAEGVGAAKAVQTAIQNLDRYIAGTQVGITLASLALGWIGEPALAAGLSALLARISPEAAEFAGHGLAVGIAFTLITALHVIIGELVPKSLALQKPETTSLVVARPMMAIVAILQPLIWSLNGLGNFVLRFLGLDAADGHASVHSATELQLLVTESHKAGMLDDLERGMIQRTFRFSETSVSDVMVRRAEMVGLDLMEPLESLLDRAATASHTRLPVYRDTLDQVEGVIYLYDLYRVVRRAGGKPVDLQSVIRMPLFVPETLHLDEVLERFRRHRIQIAIVIDEHGGTAGLVTLEDIVESVFGEVQDLNEDAAPKVSRDAKGVLTVRGDTRLDELSDMLGWRVTNDGDADTIAGFIMHRLGRVAKVGDEVETVVGRLRVSLSDRHRILQVVITPKSKLTTGE